MVVPSTRDCTQGVKGSSPLRSTMNYSIYILYNEKNDKFYIGQTNDIERRLIEHNLGKSNYTSKYNGEWRLVYQEELSDRTTVLKRERFLKNQKNKNFYKKLCNIN